MYVNVRRFFLFVFYFHLELLTVYLLAKIVFFFYFTYIRKSVTYVHMCILEVIPLVNFYRLVKQTKRVYLYWNEVIHGSTSICNSAYKYMVLIQFNLYTTSRSGKLNKSTETYRMTPKSSLGLLFTS